MKAKHRLNRVIRPLMAALLVVPLLIVIFNHADAAELKTRSIALSTSTVGVSAQHKFSFIVPSILVIGSISFEY
jgi:hypothetical protein